ncbi:phosphohydrolase [Bacillus phage SWEP1]|nr:phosphohydrolase [Bacillus phage SWEP1]
MAKKECLLCGNTNKKEIEMVPMFSDGDGNEGYFEEYMCKEGQGCC